MLSENSSSNHEISPRCDDTK